MKVFRLAVAALAAVLSAGMPAIADDDDPRPADPAQVDASADSTAIAAAAVPSIDPDPRPASPALLPRATPRASTAQPVILTPAGMAGSHLHRCTYCGQIWGGGDHGHSCLNCGRELVQEWSRRTGYYYPIYRGPVPQTTAAQVEASTPATAILDDDDPRPAFVSIETPAETQPIAGVEQFEPVYFQTSNNCAGGSCSPGRLFSIRRRN